MSKIHVTRDRQPLGQFTPEEVSEGLLSGKFLPSDLAWQQPMVGWKPLSEFSELPKSDDPVEELQEAPPPEAPAQTKPAWEDRAEHGIFESLFETIKQVLFSPTLTFREMKQEGGLEGPLIFYTALATFSSWASMLYQLPEIVMDKAVMAHLALKGVSMPMFIIIYFGVMILMPALLIMGSFLSAGLFHLSLTALGGTKKSFETTYRVFCYACGVTTVFNFIPICGGFIYLTWTLIALAIGFRETQGITSSRAIMAVLLPFLICFGVIWLSSRSVMGLGM